jgi:hypothetical protein
MLYVPNNILGKSYWGKPLSADLLVRANTFDLYSNPGQVLGITAKIVINLCLTRP